MDRPTTYWLASRIDRIRVSELKAWLADAGPEDLLDLQQALTILEAPLHDDVRALLAAEAPELDLPEE